MGLLQLAGVVSGGGNALQQGLQQTQQYMSQSTLLKERDDMERARLDITYGRELGLLQKRQDFDKESADLAHSRALDREDLRQDYESGESRKVREAQRQAAEMQAQREMEREDKRQQNVVTNKVLDASYDQQKDAIKSKADLAKEARDRAERRQSRQEDTGKDIVLKSMDAQRVKAGDTSSGKLDPNVSATLKVYDQELKDLGDELGNVMTKPERAAAIQKRMDMIRNEQFKLLGRPRPDGQAARPPLRFPE